MALNFRGLGMVRELREASQRGVLGETGMIQHLLVSGLVQGSELPQPGGQTIC